MYSRTANILGPAVTTFLDVVDQRLNGKIFLLAVEVDRVLSDSQMVTACFTEWLRPPFFVEMIQEVRRLRGWRGRSKVKKGGGLPSLPPLQPMEGQVFLSRLWWMLQEAPSPYHVPITPAHARRIIRSFIGELLGPTAWENGSSQPLHGQLAGWVEEEWRFYDLEVSILNHRFRGYFDNLGADSATLFCHTRMLYLLLSNGTD